TRLYVLDGGLRSVSPGAPGELYIAGTCLARGYHDRPDLTAEKFLPDPFSPEPGGRMYKTGDLVRALPDGNLEFLGRTDNQVKVRGYRVELAEIEAVLSQHPAVQGAVVQTDRRKRGSERLAAYVVARPGLPLSGGELRLFAKERLPDYMVPASVRLL